MLNFKSRINKIIAIAILGSVVLLFAFWVRMKRPNKNIYLPNNYEGWVIIHYKVPNTRPLPEVNGDWEVRIPANGQLSTQTTLRDGWGKDQYFTAEGQALERNEVNGTEVKARIHRHEVHYANFEQLGLTMPAGKDTTLYEDTKVGRTSDGKPAYQEGEKSVEIFYVTASQMPILFQPPPLPDSIVHESISKRKLMNKQ